MTVALLPRLVEGRLRRLDRHTDRHVTTAARCRQQQEPWKRRSEQSVRLTYECLANVGGWFRLGADDPGDPIVNLDRPLENEERVAHPPVVSASLTRFILPRCRSVLRNTHMECGAGGCGYARRSMTITDLRSSEAGRIATTSCSTGAWPRSGG